MGAINAGRYVWTGKWNDKEITYFQKVCVSKKKRETPKEMKALYSTIILVICLALLVFSCKKKEVSNATISGTVINSLTSEPMSAVTVALSPNQQTTTTDQEGKFIIENLTPQTYTVQFRIDGFETGTKNIVAVGGLNIKADIALVPMIPVLNVAEQNLNFGKDKTTLYLSIANKGKGTLRYQISIPPTDTWIDANPKAGDITNEVKVVVVTINRSSLVPKLYSTDIAVTSNAGVVTVPVTMIVQGAVPTACFVVTPPAGSTVQTFTLDPGCSTDDIDPASSLLTQVRWENPGTFTEWEILKTYQHQYTVEGSKTITLQVKDSDGNVGNMTKTVLVTNSIVKPIVTTNSVTNIGSTSATCGGTVVNEGGTSVSERGICWSTNQNPTIFDSHLQIGSGAGIYNTTLTGLTTGATYYVKAYAINLMGTSYGDEVSFTTSFVGQPPAVTTTNITGLTATGATSGGNVTVEGSSAVTARGVCWNTSGNPTVSGLHTSDGGGGGSFTSQLTELSPSTAYYVKAYATNSYGTSYGNQVDLTTPLEVITDYDGNIYYPIKIGTQVWLTRNLNTTHYSNGDSIPKVTDWIQWENIGSAAYCNYQNDPANSTVYGRLYNWYAASGPRNVCPSGWHVPTDSDWNSLFNFIGDPYNGGWALKEQGFTHWQISNSGGNDTYGFTALPGGTAYTEFSPGGFKFLSQSGRFWSSTNYQSTSSNSLSLSYSSKDYYFTPYSKTNGMSIRCIKN